MKRTYGSALLLVMAVMVIVSCSKQDTGNNTPPQVSDLIDLSPEEIMSIAYEDTTELQPSDVIAIAKDFPLALQPGMKSGGGQAVYSIHKKMYVDNNGNVGNDRVQLKGGGAFLLPVYDVDIAAGSTHMKAYISADKRFPEVLACVPRDTGSRYTVTDHPMYIYAIGTATARISYYNRLKDSLREQTLEKIRKRVGSLPEKGMLNAVKHLIRSQGTVGTKSLVIPTIPTLVINRVGPFTTTRWDQSGILGMVGSYNHKMPDITCEGNTDKAPAGCVTVAVAQALAHIMPYMTVPNYSDATTLTVDWPLLKQSSVVDDWPPYDPRVGMVGSLMRSVADGLQSSSNCSGSIALTSANMGNAINYMRQFVNVNNLQNFSVQVCKASLDNMRISLASGSRSSATGTGKIGHAWLIDGYAVARKGTVNPDNATNELVNKYDLYLHCNLGWGLSGASGWYLVNNDWTVTFDTGSGSDAERQHYRLDLKCAPYVSPK